MSLPQIRKIYEKRYLEMTNMLKGDKRKLSPERQHQIYGAIVEIKSFLETVREHEDKQKNDQVGTFLDVSKPEECVSSGKFTFSSFIDTFKRRKI